MKKYIIKPDITGNSRKWVLYSDDTEILHGKHKDAFVQDSIRYVKKHGGGSLSIMRMDGSFQEERTFPQGRETRVKV